VDYHHLDTSFVPSIVFLSLFTLFYQLLILSLNVGHLGPVLFRNFASHFDFLLRCMFLTFIFIFITFTINYSGSVALLLFFIWSAPTSFNPAPSGVCPVFRLAYQPAHLDLKVQGQGRLGGCPVARLEYLLVGLQIAGSRGLDRLGRRLANFLTFKFLNSWLPLSSLSPF